VFLEGSTASILELCPFSILPSTAMSTRPAFDRFRVQVFRPQAVGIQS